MDPLLKALHDVLLIRSMAAHVDEIDFVGLERILEQGCDRLGLKPEAMNMMREVCASLRVFADTYNEHKEKFHAPQDSDPQ